MPIAKLINRLRRRFARALDARPTLPTRASHTAYPETQIADDGSWVVRFYSYEPIGWLVKGEKEASFTGWRTPPPAVPEPELAHPTTFAEGRAPAENVLAWRRYYADRPKAITLLEELTGQAANREVAAKAAYRALRSRVEHYRRES